MDAATNSLNTSRCVLVCQNRTCRKQGAADVLAAFERLTESDVTVRKSGCLGQCGNGPMVLVMPEQIWYCNVDPNEVSTVVSCHLQGGCPVKAMLYPKYHG